MSIEELQYDGYCNYYRGLPLLPKNSNLIYVSERKSYNIEDAEFLGTCDTLIKIMFNKKEFIHE